MKEEEIEKTPVIKSQENEEERKPKYEFALSIVTEGKESLICRRSMFIDNYIENSMKTADFKDCVDRIVDMIHQDLLYKSYVYLQYRYPSSEFIPSPKEVKALLENGNSEELSLRYKIVKEKNIDGQEIDTAKPYVTRVFPDWETELTIPAKEKQTPVEFRFTVYEKGQAVITREWDATIYPSYIRKNVDLTNRLVRVYRDNNVYTYDKETFFAENDNLYGELSMLKVMIMNREDLIPKITDLICEVCSSNSGYYDNINDYHTVGVYVTPKTDENGRIVRDDKGKRVIADSKSYNFNIHACNNKYYDGWRRAVAKKTARYTEEHYYTPAQSRVKKFVKK